MKTRFVIALAIATVMTVAVSVTMGAAAPAKTCGTGGTVGGVKLPTSQQSPTIAAICKAGELSAGQAPVAPWGFDDAKGTPRGPGVEIIGPALARDLGVKFHLIQVGWDTVVAGLQAHRYDMIMGGLTFTPDRNKVISYALYSHIGTCYAVPKGSGLTTLASLNSPNVTFVGWSGTSWQTDVPKKFPKAKFNWVTPAAGASYDLLDVVAKRGNATPIDNVAALAVAAGYPSLQIVPSPKVCMSHPDMLQPLGMGLWHGDTAYQHFVQAVVKKDNAKIQAMLTKYSSPKYINVGHQ